MYVRVCGCTHVYLSYVNLHARLHVRTYASAFMHLFVRAPMCACICMPARGLYLYSTYVCLYTEASHPMNTQSTAPRIYDCNLNLLELSRCDSYLSVCLSRCPSVRLLMCILIGRGRLPKRRSHPIGFLLHHIILYCMQQLHLVCEGSRRG